MKPRLNNKTKFQILKLALIKAKEKRLSKQFTTRNVGLQTPINS